MATSPSYANPASAPRDEPAALASPAAQGLPFGRLSFGALRSDSSVVRFLLSLRRRLRWVASPIATLPRMVALLAIFGAFFAVAVTGWVSWNQWQASLRASEIATSRAAFFLGEHGARLFEASDLALERSRNLTKGRIWTSVASDRRVHRELRRIRDDLPHIRDLWLNDASAKARQTSFDFPAPTVSAAGREAFRAHRAGALGDVLYAAEPVVGRVTKERTILVSRRIATTDGRFRGVALATLSLDYFTDLWKRVPLPGAARVVLFRASDGQVLSSYPDDPDATDGLPIELAGAIAVKPRGGTYESVGGADERVGSYRRLGDLPLYVRVSLSRGDLLRAWWKEMRRSALFAGLAIASLGGLGVFAAHQAHRADTDRRRLKGEVARQTASLREEKRILESINHASRALSQEIDREEAVERVLGLGRELAGAEYAAFLDRWQYGARDAVRGPCTEGEVLRTGDVSAVPLPDGIALAAAGWPGGAAVRSVLCVPVASRDGTVHGTLLFGHRRPDRFTLRHEALVRGVAAQAAIVMDNAHLFSSAQDEIARRRDSERQQRLLIRELHHRVKNTLATVRAIATVSSRTAEDFEDFTSGFSDRLTALGSTHTLLIDTAWGHVGLHDLVEKELGPYRGGGHVVGIRGAPTNLVPQQAVSLGMALHELTTNAVKYGALSTPDGRIDVEWSISEGNEGAQLRLSWRESGGPTVVAPEREGFGSTLLRKVLKLQLSAEVDVAYDPAGIRYAITFPLNGEATFHADRAA